MVAGGIEQKIRNMTDEDLDSKIIQMLREASAELLKLQGELDKLRKWQESAKLSLATLTSSVTNLESDNARLRVVFKEYGRHKNRCEWTNYGGCDCGLDDALKESGSE